MWSNPPSQSRPLFVGAAGRNTSGSNTHPPLITRQMVWVLRMSSRGLASSKTRSAASFSPASSAPHAQWRIVAHSIPRPAACSPGRRSSRPTDFGATRLAGGRVDTRRGPRDFGLGAEGGGYVAQFDSSLNQVWLKQVGSSGYEEFISLVPDGDGGVLVAGATFGDLGGDNAGSADAVLARGDERDVVCIEQFGTSGDDIVQGLSTDEVGGVFVGGITSSDLFGEFQGGNWDAFIARYGCLADLDGNGSIGVSDFLSLLASWGPCPPKADYCPADFDGDGNVGVSDFLTLLANWGPCP